MSPNEKDIDYSALQEINRLVHEPARLAILAVLAGCESADFQFLMNMTGLSKGNLSAQSIKLAEAGYILIEKSFNGRMPSTRYQMAPLGRTALDQYSKQLKLTLDTIDPGKLGKF